ncbi:FAD-dependent monooxygenase [Citricoccus sp. NR2]|uniref:FAD-dependent monooxygenase n=1 Tax=Citricoccus sp. NR2 TaxID=3004095 RepID=UPI0022DDCADA|nr:FAD-dependent monooxygenase [Citricoccus sp. NR2]WBL19565.1 FAD-dependent monooxygenase [Citricoccus sp. NR2]
MTIRIACIGGGPGGLFFSTLMKRHLPEADVVLFERNQAGDAFGFGVVFSDATLRKITDADPVLDNALTSDGTHWDTLQVWLKGERHSFTGNGMSAIHRKTLLSALQETASEAGVEMRFGSVVSSLEDLKEFDLIVAADGANSNTRRLVGAKELQHKEAQASAKFIWFGTTYMFDGLTFLHRQSEHGNFAAHAYPISDELSTFIVEADEQTWRNAQLDEFDVSQPPGISDMKSKKYIEELFAEDLQGHEVVTNNSRWGNFRTRTSGRWFHDNVVFLGDALHTAHFSVGSGTKMAMEDAIVLARSVADHPKDLPAALEEYEKIRMPEVAKVQNAARPSLSWWEHFGRYYNSLAPLQFTFHFVSRSISIEKVRQRDPELVAAVEKEWHDEHGHAPLLTPVTLAGVNFTGRLLSLHEGTMTNDDERLPLDALDLTILEAPDHEEQLGSIMATLPTSGTVLVRGGTPLTRRLISEEARLSRNLTTIIAEPTDEEAATTAVLSGRADAVANEVAK